MRELGILSLVCGVMWALAYVVSVDAAWTESEMDEINQRSRIVAEKCERALEQWRDGFEARRGIAK